MLQLVQYLLVGLIYLVLLNAVFSDAYIEELDLIILEVFFAQKWLEEQSLSLRPLRRLIHLFL